MSQTITPEQWVYIVAAGTTVISSLPGAVLKRVIFGGTFVGSVEFYNSATVGGTSATRNIYNVGLPLLNQYKSVDINAGADTGLVYVSTGTPTLTVLWGY